ncbi:DUF1697 domain-containing protein [Taibaiella soli]|uniref:DUF1697 domain-containing protein n=1 Tax=Taibaiella soli TaxID=1649169 RepID=A0A2W2AXJ9_9BACT|nr:DUF1697 domain-containing protein [Taibaiella soli]PZF72724.1 DUF1697 domain-containing protein [Taibaiella soli]
MKTCISMLRGINVSGKNKILMKELQTMYEAMGYENVRTYIQSGNVVFETKKKTDIALAKEIKQQIEETFGFDVPVIIRGLDEMNHALEHNPFLKQKDIDLSRLHVTFLSEVPSKEHLAKLKDQNYAPDEFIIEGKEIYLHIPVSYGNTKLNNNFWESKLKVTATTRNWKTVNELVKIATEPTDKIKKK